MSIQDERELRDRLSGLLDSVQPELPPVAGAMRQGKVIRMRRWVSAAAGVAVVAAGAIVLPGLIHGQRTAPPTSSRHYTVTADVLGPTARGGVIGAGTINNKHWRVVLSGTFGSNQGCATEEYLLTCGPNPGIAVGPREVNIGETGAGRTQFEYGIVGSGVTRVVIRLSNGTELDLRPVLAYGHRWVAVAVPVRAVVEAESFVGGAEYQYAVPYVGRTYSEFVTWLNPGQLGLRRDVKQVGTGEIDRVRWHTAVAAGPWGYCVLFTDGSACTPTATRLQPPSIGKPLQLTCQRLFNTQRQIPATAGVAFLPAGVKNVVLTFADGSHLRLVGVPVGGVRAVGYAVPNRPKVVRTQEYGFKGQLVASLPGGDWGC